MSTQTNKEVSIIKQGNTILIAEPVAQKSFFDSFSQFFNSKPILETNNPVAADQCTWTDVFASSNIQQLKKNWKCKRDQWKDSDVRIAGSITKFKEEYIVTVGDIRVRSVLMAFSSALLYKAVSVNTIGLFRKTRNLGICFAFMGYWFVPELFNPFLQKPKLVKTVL